jgi:large subunit ribosomal protein L5
MAAETATAPPARLKVRYLEEIRPALISRFGYSSPMQAPKVEKITINMGVGLAKQDSKMLKAASDQLATIAGQQPSIRRARKSIAAFKLREGMPVGVAVTLRGERGYEFLDRLISIAIPRIRDFRGLNPRSFDGRGNYSMGVKEQIIFPEIDYDAIDQVRGLDITITTSASSDVEAYALLAALGMPFTSQGRPKGYDPEADAAAERAHEEAQAAAAAKAAEAEAPPQPAPVEVETERQAEPEAEPEPEAEAAEPAAEVEPEPEAGAAPEPEAEPAPEADAEAAPKPEAEAAPEPEAEAAPEPEAEAAPEPEAEAEPEVEAAPEPEAAAQPQAEPEVVEAAPEPAAEAEAHTSEAASETESVAETPAEPEPEQAAEENSEKESSD